MNKIVRDGSNNLMLCISYSYIERLHNNIHTVSVSWLPTCHPYFVLPVISVLVH